MFCIGITPALQVSLSYTRDNNLAGIQTSEAGAVCAIYIRVQKRCILVDLQTLQLFTR